MRLHRLEGALELYAGPNGPWKKPKKEWKWDESFFAGKTYTIVFDPARPGGNDCRYLFHNGKGLIVTASKYPVLYHSESKGDVPIESLHSSHLIRAYKKLHDSPNLSPVDCVVMESMVQEIEERGFRIEIGNDGPEITGEERKSDAIPPA